MVEYVADGVVSLQIADADSSITGAVAPHNNAAAKLPGTLIVDASVSVLP